LKIGFNTTFLRLEKIAECLIDWVHGNRMFLYDERGMSLKTDSIKSFLTPSGNGLKITIGASLIRFQENANNGLLVGLDEKMFKTWRNS